MSKSELRTEWEQRISDFIASGQSASKWCATNEINIHQFWYWKRRLKDLQDQVTGSSKWLSIEMDDSTETPSNTLIVRVGQSSVEVKSGFDPNLLADVVRTLRSIC
jgi:hypothetical protein